MTSVSVRYIVDDVDAAIEFYTGELGFERVMHPAPSFAITVPTSATRSSRASEAGRS